MIFNYITSFTELTNINNNQPTIMDIKQREKLADLCYNCMKKDIICAEGGMDCAKPCMDHASMLGLTIVLIMRGSPKWKEMMRMCQEGAKECATVCAKHTDSAFCKECATMCQKLCDETKGLASM